MDRTHAGLRDLDHYKSKLPAWRYWPRQWLIPIVRWETPHLARFQRAWRNPTLDSYFALTANLGTHTFFMVTLPVCFWCGYTSLGRALVHILATGVFFSGFIKDLLCLPRPLSPPLHRISMSEGVSLEYGFPSTHTTNAVSIAVYALLCTHWTSAPLPWPTKLTIELLSYVYVASIAIGRLYCGMHGFFDVTVGTLLGAALSLIEFYFVDTFDEFTYAGGSKAVFITVLSVLVLVRVHPEPADDCPCFDDSVAFAGVFCGIEMGTWHFAQTTYSWNDPVPATVPYSLEELGWITTLLRILVGVLFIFIWRGAMKPFLLKSLPPIFRVIEFLGLGIPRKYFMKASEYDKVPEDLETDRVVPPVSELPHFISKVRHPRRNRSISIGPQSEADAYEALAYRDKARRDSRSSGSGPGAPQPAAAVYDTGARTQPDDALRTRHHGGDAVVDAEFTLVDMPPSSGLAAPPVERTPSQERREDEREKKEIFAKVEKPRVRYDVEVVTKLIVYTGIAWIAVEWAPMIFESIGLGMGQGPYMKFSYPYLDINCSSGRLKPPWLVAPAQSAPAQGP